MKKRAIISLLTLVVATTSGVAAAVVSPKPFVIPELREWVGESGNFEIDKNTKIVINSDEAAVVAAANALSTDYAKMFDTELAVTKGKAKAGSISFELITDESLGQEGYTIEIGKSIIAKAQTAQGLYWATRSLLQIADDEVDGELPRGYIKDYPEYETRGFLIDVARKYIPLSYLEDYVDILAYYKMNTLHIHLNDNGLCALFDEDWERNYAAFRLESDKFPGLTAQDGHYTKQEFIDLQILAESKHVDIIPEIDVPAHSFAFGRYMPEIASEYGPNYLDLFNPKTYEFVDALFDEYLSGDSPVFRGEMVHIGTDEYKVSEEEHVREKFRYFADRYINYVESYGKKAGLWGSFTHMHGKTPIKKSKDITMFVWSNGYANPQEVIDDGYSVINVAARQTYIVPTATYYNDYLNVEMLYNEWTPAIINNAVFEENHPSIKGGMFALWNDLMGSGISLKDLHDRTMPATQVIAAKCWSASKTTTPYETYKAKYPLMAEAPGVNIAGRIGEPNTLVYECDVVEPNSTTPYEEVGYGYTISFVLDGVPEEKGTVLFESDFAKFYLSDPINGMIGFSRDENLYSFRVSTYNKKSATITIQGDQEATSIYVDGVLAHTMRTVRRYIAAEERKLKMLSTLVFPLAKTGDFKSKVTDLKVYNYKTDITK